MKPVLTINTLQKEAFEFCKQYSEKPIHQLFGVTDGKAVGTYIEHLLKEYLSEKYTLCIGNSAKGLDLPSVDTDIKVTSVKQPQSSCPFKDSKQKIFGLGYNLLVLVYDKHDDPVRMAGILKFVSCCFVDKSRTADYQTTTGILKLIENNANADDIFAFLSDRNIPGDDVTLYAMAEEVLKAPPQIGYLTISNALQWRLQYGRIVNLNENIRGINPIIRYDK